MKKINFLFLSLISLAFLFNACKSSTTSPSNPTSGPGSSYFPNGDGTTYKYAVTKTDSSGNQSAGTRSTTYSGTTTLNGAVYQNEIDTISFGGFSIVTSSLFVKSNNSVNFAIDTSGLSASIPSQYLQYIKLSSSITAFKFPLQQGNPWNAFNMTLSLSGLTDTLVNVTGTYIGMEQVPLTLSTGSTTMNAAKIQYIFKLQIPNPSNPFQFDTRSYSAFAWMADNVGMIKMEGNGAILDAFTGGGINFADTTSTISQSLISYNIAK